MNHSTQPIDHPRTFSMQPLLTVAAHAILWGLWMLLLFAFVPRCESIFRKVNLKLPTATELVLSLTHGFIPSALLLVLIFLAIDGAVYSRLRRSVAQKLWSGLMTVVPVVVIILTCVAICIPSLKVLEGLAK
ncbi:MAG TPA: hypothetical protein VH682_27255 [Gemmataceae bacterium]